MVWARPGGAPAGCIDAWMCTGSPVASRPDETTSDCCVDPTETQWRAALDRAKEAGLVWSPEIQDFILGR